ncbi:hypothetical protein QFZ82_004633 [Streptomyces sp. V4I23]|nr:hypothetical protein [Streptomyces sp. V4I23]MDQ1010148.1 hypothetical protein [Streptomyces sp. V4I23]
MHDPHDEGCGAAAFAMALGLGTAGTAMADNHIPVAPLDNHIP